MALKRLLMVLLMSLTVSAMAAPGAVNRPTAETIEECIRITGMQQIVDGSLAAYDRQLLSQFLLSQFPMEERLRVKRQMEDGAGTSGVCLMPSASAAAPDPRAC